MVARGKLRRSTKRKAVKRKAPKRKAVKRKAPKRKAVKRKAPTRKAKTPRKPRYSLLITQSQRNSRNFKAVVLKNNNVVGEPRKIIASKISTTTSNIINYARRKRVNLSKAWDAVA